ncbi:TetR/AcrR family transcriptional regulator [Lichenicola cladoniae]|uniref:TetR/AcrR family transcriptional regulator n=1 Tax=Lichenicola cladoniae TaxID=1484109 RepID=A0A6M8HP18_9PROT|nr:TetR/AcrR family transcriptional regulator [Lichenicola cladoniae]NPD68488.1 TetR/AcrR family transcriptional regulator [Acetobacteraceae bacterium]QKE90035.1 TetR/AcrR family transcriptional regulator [Lichenicola cladoniae]
MARTGRPRNFDRDEALGTAMHLFWEHGYEGVSLDQLRQAMGGISSASFYAAFGAKEALYREALSRYLSIHGRVVEALRDTSLSPRARLEQALRRSAVMQTGAAHPAGCMVTLSSTICSTGGTSVRAVTAAERAANRAAIFACVEAGVADGLLRPETDVTGLSTLFEGVLVGLSIQARDGVAADAFGAAITQALKAWDANWAGALER